MGTPFNSVLWLHFKGFSVNFICLKLCGLCTGIDYLGQVTLFIARLLNYNSIVFINVVANAGENYKLKMRLVDHIFDDMVVEELVTKVILPEGSHKVELLPPYHVQRLPDYMHFTYLDTKGRPVISMRKTNVVENHIQDFEVSVLFNPLNTYKPSII